MASQVEEYGAGMCVAVDEHNGYDDSDFYGVFAVPAEGGGFTFTYVCTGSTRHAGGYIPKVDATDEVKAAYKVARAAAVEKLAAQRAAAQAKVPVKGQAVTVVKAVTRGKNKVEAGETGVVFWRDVDKFSRYTDVYRVGVEIAGRKVFLAEENVRVQGFEDEPIPVISLAVEYAGLRAWPNIR